MVLPIYWPTCALESILMTVFMVAVKRRDRFFLPTRGCYSKTRRSSDIQFMSQSQSGSFPLFCGCDGNVWKCKRKVFHVDVNPMMLHQHITQWNVEDIIYSQAWTEMPHRAMVVQIRNMELRQIALQYIAECIVRQPEDHGNNPYSKASIKQSLANWPTVFGHLGSDKEDVHKEDGERNH